MEGYSFTIKQAAFNPESIRLTILSLMGIIQNYNRFADAMNDNFISANEVGNTHSLLPYPLMELSYQFYPNDTVSFTLQVKHSDVTKNSIYNMTKIAKDYNDIIKDKEYIEKEKEKLQKEWDELKFITEKPEEANKLSDTELVEQIEKDLRKQYIEDL